VTPNDLPRTSLAVFTTVIRTLPKRRYRSKVSQRLKALPSEGTASKVFVAFLPIFKQNLIHARRSGILSRREIAVLYKTFNMERVLSMTGLRQRLQFHTNIPEIASSLLPFNNISGIISIRLFIEHPSYIWKRRRLCRSVSRRTIKVYPFHVPPWLTKTKLVTGRNDVKLSFVQ